MRARALVVIADDRPVAEDALAPADKVTDPVGWVTVAALALGPMLALAFAFAGLAEVARALAFASLVGPVTYALLAGAFALDMRVAAKRAVEAERSEEPTGPPKLW